MLKGRTDDHAATRPGQRSRWSTYLAAWPTPLSDETHGQAAPWGGRERSLPRMYTKIAMLGAYAGLLRNPSA